MPRARINKNGIAIAKAGYDVDTASIENMAFSPQFGMMRLAMTGTVDVVDFTGYMSDMYRRAIVVFPTAAPRPPLVMVCGLFADGSTDQTVAVVRVASDQSGRAWQKPAYEIRTTATQFELYVNKEGSPLPTRPTTWRYWVFHNTLDV